MESLTESEVIFFSHKGCRSWSALRGGSASAFFRYPLASHPLIVTVTMSRTCVFRKSPVISTSFW